MAHGELAWLFHEPHTGLEVGLNILLSCFRKMMSVEGIHFHFRRRRHHVRVRVCTVTLVVFLSLDMGSLDDRSVAPKKMTKTANRNRKQGGSPPPAFRRRV